MFKTPLYWIVLAVIWTVAAPARAQPVICSFGATGVPQGTDCVGNPWNYDPNVSTWSIPFAGSGLTPWPGPEIATDFHFRCLSGCGAIENDPSSATKFGVDLFSTVFWNETINPDGSIDLNPRPNCASGSPTRSAADRSSRVRQKKQSSTSRSIDR